MSPGVPGPVMVAQVLLGLGAVVTALSGALLLWLSVTILRADSALGAGGIAVGLLCLGIAVVKYRLKVGLGRGECRARDLLWVIVAVDVLDLAVGCALAASPPGPTDLGPLLLDAVIIALVRVPVMSRAHFLGTGASADDEASAITLPIPVQRPATHHPESPARSHRRRPAGIGWLLLLPALLLIPLLVIAAVVIGTAHPGAAAPPAAPTAPQASVPTGPRIFLAAVDATNPADGDHATFGIYGGKAIPLSQMNNPALVRSVSDQFPSWSDGVNRAIVIPLHAEGRLLRASGGAPSEWMSLTLAPHRGAESIIPLICTPEGTCLNENSSQETPALWEGDTSVGPTTGGDVLAVIPGAIEGEWTTGDPRIFGRYFLTISPRLDPVGATGPTVATVSGPYACRATVRGDAYDIVGFGVRPAECAGR